MSKSEFPEVIGIPLAHEPPIGEERIQSGEKSVLAITYGTGLAVKGDVLKVVVLEVDKSGKEIRHLIYQSVNQVGDV